MEYKIKVNLAKGELPDFINKLKTVKKETGSTNYKIRYDMIQVGKNTIKNSLGSNLFTPNEPTKVYSQKGKEVGIKGSQSIYDEFGTGNYGEAKAHPLKGEYNLNGYNSGKTIRINKDNSTNATENGIPVGSLYWAYKYQGVKYYTMGRPAGMHVYRASKNMQRKFRSISKKRVGEWLSKLY